MFIDFPTERRHPRCHRITKCVTHYRVLPAIQVAVTRRVISHGTLHGPEEATTAEQAARAYSTGAAAAVGVDNTAGSITVGKQADP